MSTPLSIEDLRRLYLDFSLLNKNIVHIAGSKGKGTVAYLIATLLKKRGFKVGLFTSPALLEDREMIQIDGKTISEEEFGKLNQFFIQKAPNLSPFERLTFMALKAFSEENCDYTILECGWGGQNDATNLTTEKCLTILTHLELEHREVLGDTLEKIALNKLGICRPGVPLLTPENQRGFVKSLLNQNVPLIAAALENSADLPHHPESVSLALAALKELGFDSSHEDLLSLKTATIPGRMERVEFSGHVAILDGAHTMDSLRFVREQVEKIAKTEGFEEIFWAAHFLKDKNSELWTLLPPENSVWIPLKDERAGECPSLMKNQTLEEFYASVQPLPEKSLVVFVGSFRLVAAVKRFLHENIKVD